MSDVAAAKAQLRSLVRARLRERGAAALGEAGARVAGHLEALLPESGVVALYASRPLELSTASLDALLRARGLRRAVPRIAGDDLVFKVVDDAVGLAVLPPDPLGIPTPPESAATVALADCALVVVPGLAFDRRGGRLGHGRGYYDRALAGVPDGRVIAVLDGCQWVEAVPCTPLDRRVARLCSPAGVVAADS